MIPESASEAFRNPQLIRIATAMLISSMVGIAALIHMVPILREMGVSRAAAAQIAAMAGVAGIAAKLITGWLYDRGSSSWIGALIFSLPAIGFSLLLEPVRTPLLIVVAMALLSYSAGGTLQVCVYLTTRYAGLRNYGKIFGVMASLIACSTGAGPVLGGMIYDQFGSYTPLILAGIPIALICGLLVTGLGPYPTWTEARSA